MFSSFLPFTDSIDCCWVSADLEMPCVDACHSDLSQKGLSFDFAVKPIDCLLK